MPEVNIFSARKRDIRDGMAGVAASLYELKETTFFDQGRFMASNMMYSIA